MGCCFSSNISEPILFTDDYSNGYLNHSKSRQTEICSVDNDNDNSNSNNHQLNAPILPKKQNTYRPILDWLIRNQKRN